MRWIGGSLPTANWVYAAVRQNDDTRAPDGAPCAAPTGLSFFGGGFFSPPPEAWTRRVRRVVQRRDHAEGGHFPALTRPDALAADLSAFASAVD